MIITLQFLFALYELVTSNLTHPYLSITHIRSEICKCLCVLSSEENLSESNIFKVIFKELIMNG